MKAIKTEQNNQAPSMQPQALANSVVAFNVPQTAPATSLPDFSNPLRYSLNNVQMINADPVTGLPATEVKQLAASGVTGTPRSMPYYDKMQQAFGADKLNEVQVYTDGNAQRAAKAIGARAYATGNKIAFASSNPSLFEVAHETTHVFQQQAGVQLFGGVGEVGDHYEQQADAVASLVQNESQATLATKIAESFAELNSATYTAASNGNVQRMVEYAQAKDPVELIAPTIMGISDTDIKTYLKDLKDDAYTVYLFTKSVRKKQLEEYIKLRDKYKGAFTPPDRKTPDYDDYNAYIKAYPDYYLNWLAYLSKCTEAPKIARSPILGKLPETNDFLPGVIKANADEMDFNLTKFATQVSPDNSVTAADQPKSLKFLNSTSTEVELSGLTTKDNLSTIEFSIIGKDEKDKLKKFRETYRDTHEKGAKAEGYGTGTDGYKTSIKWGPAVGMSGTSMHAVVGPDHSLGSTPSSDLATQAVEDMETLANPSSSKAVTYIRGHLLNEQIGGPGDDVRNLAPISTKANDMHKRGVEKEVKNLVNKQHYWIWYNVDVVRKDLSEGLDDEQKDDFEKKIGKKGKDGKTGAFNNPKIVNAVRRSGGKYPAEFQTEWGFMKYDITTKKLGRINATKKYANLKFANPLAIRYALAEKTLEVINQDDSFYSDEDKDITEKTTAETKAKAQLSYNNVILSTNLKVKARLMGSSEYEPYIIKQQSLINVLQNLTKRLDFIKFLRENDTDFKDGELTLTKKINVFKEQYKVIEGKVITGGKLSSSSTNRVYQQVKPLQDDLANFKTLALTKVAEFIKAYVKGTWLNSYKEHGIHQEELLKQLKQSAENTVSEFTKNVLKLYLVEQVDLVSQQITTEGVNLNGLILNFKQIRQRNQSQRLQKLRDEITQQLWSLVEQGKLNIQDARELFGKLPQQGDQITLLKMRTEYDKALNPEAEGGSGAGVSVEGMRLFSQMEDDSQEVNLADFEDELMTEFKEQAALKKRKTEEKSIDDYFKFD